MMYSDKEAAQILNVGTNGLKRIRLILRKMNLLADREKISDARLPLFQQIVDRQKQQGGTYESAIKQILEENKRQILLSIFEENDNTRALDTFSEILGHYYDNPGQVLDKFLEDFVSITDVLRKIGNETAALFLENTQEDLVNSIVLRYLYQQNRIN